MSKVFISYSHKDKEWVKEWLMPRLEMAGVAVHIDFRDFEIGQPALVNLEKAVKECKWTILVYTPDWIHSQWTDFEGLILMHRDPTNLKKCMRPLMLKKCELPDRLSVFTYADFTDENNWEAELKRILDQMGKEYTPFLVVPDRKDKTVAIDISLSRLPVTDSAVFGREKEVALLDEAWKDEHANVVTLIAWGGVGKTALVNHWLNGMAKDHFRGAEKVYGWSFYSQGAAEGKQASADEFMHDTLCWFGDLDPTSGAPEEKGRRLAGLVRKSKTLLVLDGMEPLQHPPGKDQSMSGRLKDPGLRALLRELAVSQPGLCVVTTRETVTDLSAYGEPAVKGIALEHLSLEAGTELLKHLGIKGKEQEITEAVNEYGGHALALTLLGNYLCMGYDGDIRKRDAIGPLIGEPGTGEHAKRMMQAYYHWLGESAELNILYIMGLFDRPVEEGALEILKSSPAIPGLTERLVELSPVQWNYALNRLRKLGLLAKEDAHKAKAGGLDCHPLVREYFGERLKQENPTAWKEAHTRLYEYYRKLPKKELPDTLEEMSPLFSAVAHGCLAGRHQEVMDEVYEKRIRRGGREAFIVHKLGAFGVDLSALAHFFDVPWDCPASGLRERFKAVVLNWSAFALRAMGRLREAAQPMKAGLEMRVRQEDWENAAKGANNLSELLLTLGDLKGAVAAARESVAHADRSGKWQWEMAFRTTLADALHQADQSQEAEALFREAEEMQRKRQPGFHFLYSLPGFRLCNLLLEQGKVREVIERAETTLGWMLRDPHAPILTVVLDYLTLGRAWLERAQKDHATDQHAEPWTRAREFLDRAVVGMREAGYQEFLSRGLLARAACSRWRGDFDHAWNDLSEALEIADAGDMKLHICDYHLEAARLCIAEGKQNDASEHYRIAAELIEETGYYRRKKELP